jgi:Tfp pilus assembly protein PilF
MTTVLFALWLGFFQIPGRNLSDLDGTLIAPSTVELPPALVVDLESDSGQPVDRTYADAEGRFTFHGIAPGNYFLRIDQPGLSIVHQFVRLPFVHRVVITLRSLMPATEKYVPPPNGEYTVDLSELELPEKAISEYEKGLTDARDGDQRHAIDHFKKALKIAPEYYSAHLWLGRIYDETGKIDDAEKHFQRSAEIRTDAAEPLMRLGQMLLRKQLYDKALPAFQEASARDSNTFEIQYGLGYSFYCLHKFAEAAPALLEAQRLSPTNPYTQLLLVNVFLKLRNLDGAMKQIDKYLAEHPDGDKRDEVVALRKRVATALRQPF